MCWYEIVKVLIRPFGHPEWQGEERNYFLTCIGMNKQVLVVVDLEDILMLMILVALVE